MTTTRKKTTLYSSLDSNKVANKSRDSSKEAKKASVSSSEKSLLEVWCQGRSGEREEGRSAKLLRHLLVLLMTHLLWKPAEYCLSDLDDRLGGRWSFRAIWPDYEDTTIQRRRLGLRVYKGLKRRLSEGNQLRDSLLSTHLVFNTSSLGSHGLILGRL